MIATTVWRLRTGCAFACTFLGAISSVALDVEPSGSLDGNPELNMKSRQAEVMSVTSRSEAPSTFGGGPP
jgi:hypothetical protein